MSQRNSGFTFFEMLIVITVLFVIVTLIPMIMKQAINNVKFDVVSDQEVTVFFQYLARDMREAKQYELDGNAILLKKR
ncbi:prepilin-type N-terminal cleavage/methylation domain-containing protein [Bacillus sp. JCM 19034]|uniref:prepilin-type N-terminal cleavage/methylation domain-containing protein n=1 Tax=Bacillus sp. JCM 19034 TaxID=1481928 RepID=UPI000784BFC6|nr:prepilin-type N-terminal cleavage/methylation domain-containing protein [Bacillus sp. JCM 19034]